MEGKDKQEPKKSIFHINWCFLKNVILRIFDTYKTADELLMTNNREHFDYLKGRIDENN